MGRPGIDITGKVFGNLTVVGKSELHSTTKNLKWILSCACGGSGLASYSDLKRGRTNFCTSCREVKSVWAPIRVIYAAYKRAALAKKREFTLTKGQFSNIISSDCFYCDSPPSQLLSKKGMREHLYYNVVDRVDNLRGYTIDNVVAACKFCNFAKKSCPVEEFEAWLDRVAMSSMTRKGLI